MSGLTDTVMELRRCGAAPTRIARTLHVTPERVLRILASRPQFLPEQAPINDLPQIQGAFDPHGWPLDEQLTTRSIYAAAEQIRERRPRPPVGYERFSDPLEVARGSLEIGSHRGGTFKL